MLCKVQLLENQPLEALLPVLQPLLADSDQNKQRAAAELLAGLLGGSKHWKIDAQNQLWDWLTPLLPRVYDHIRTNTLTTWTTFLEVLSSVILFLQIISSLTVYFL